jgi:hypothetical protein
VASSRRSEPDDPTAGLPEDLAAVPQPSSDTSPSTSDSSTSPSEKAERPLSEMGDPLHSRALQRLRPRVREDLLVLNSPNEDALAALDSLTAALAEWKHNYATRNEDAELLEKAANAALARAQKAEAVVEAAREIRGYVRAHLAGNDADPELTWALEQADAALTALDSEEG